MTERDFLSSFLNGKLVVNCCGRHSAEDFLAHVAAVSSIRTRCGFPVESLADYVSETGVIGFGVYGDGVAYRTGGYKSECLEVYPPIPSIWWWGPVEVAADLPTQEFDEWGFQALLGGAHL